MDLTAKVMNAVRADYQRRLSQMGIPSDPASRTEEQRGEAALNFWAVKMEASFAVDTLLQTVLETN
jgi:hypothetical protein